MIANNVLYIEKSSVDMPWGSISTLFCGIFPQFFLTFHNFTFLASTPIIADIQALTPHWHILARRL